MKPFRVFIAKFFRRCWYTFAVLIVLVAVCISLVRALLPMADQYRDEFSDWLRTEHDVIVQIDKIDAGWLRGPALVLRGVELQLGSSHTEQTDTTLEINEVRLNLLAWTSLWTQSIVFGDILFSGMEIDLSNLNPSKSEPQQNLDISRIEGWMQLFMNRLNEFSIQDSKIHVRMPNGQRRTLGLQQLNWVNTPNQHLAEGSLLLEQEPSVPHFFHTQSHHALEFALDLTSQDTFRSLQGQIFLAGRKLELKDWIEQRIPGAQHFRDSDINFDVWVDIDEGKVQQLLAQLSPSSLQWQSGQGLDHEIRLNGGYLRWQRNGQTWKLETQQLQLEANQHAWPEVMLAVKADASDVDIQVGQLKVEHLSPLFSLFSATEKEGLAAIEQANFRGHLEKLHVRIPRDAPDKSRFRARFNGVGADAAGAIVGFDHASLLLEGDSERGVIELSLPEGRVDARAYVNTVYHQASLSTRLHWHRHEQGINIWSQMFEATTEAIRLDSHFALSLGNKEYPKPAELSLYGEVDLSDAKDVHHYYPLPFMSKRLVDYLTLGIQAGYAERAQILWYGPLNQFPYDDHTGIFQADLTLQDAQFQFGKGWHPLTELELHLLFENAGLSMSSIQARLLDARATRIQADIPRLSKQGSLLIDADVEGDAQDVTKYLQESPLSGSVGEALSVLHIEKAIQGNLRLDIPFNGQAVDARGDIKLAGNPVKLRKPEMLLDNVTGNFSFANDRLSGQKLTADYLGQPVALGFRTAGIPGLYQIGIDLNANWQVDKSLAIFSLPLSESISGHFDWDGHIDINLRPRYASYQVGLNSRFAQTQIDLPAPLAKTKGLSLPTRVQFTGDLNRAYLDVQLGPEVLYQTQLDFNPDGVKVPYFKMGVGKPDRINFNRMDTSEIRISRDHLDVAGWLPAIFAIDKYLIDKGGDKKPVPLKIEAKYADLGGTELRNWLFESRHKGDGLEVVSLSDKIQGRVEIMPGKTLKAHFNKLHLSLPSQSADKGPEPKHESESLTGSKVLNWKDIPALNFTCDDCRINESQLPNLSARLRPRGQGVDLLDMTVGWEHSQLEMEGRWSGLLEQDYIQLQGKVKSDSFEQLLASLDYQSPLRDTPGSVQFVLGWSGNPWKPQIETLSGQVQTRGGEGHLDQVSDKGARFFSLLSLDSLLRKLRLDFRDVFDKGLFYRSIEATASIQHGQVRFENFRLDGMAGLLKAKGELDLPNKQMDVDLRFSPDLTSSLPVVTAFVVTPVAGVTVLALSKLLSPVVEVITELRFRAHGDLRSPEFEEVRRSSREIDIKENFSR